MAKAITINATDNLAVALTDLTAGETLTVNDNTVTLTHDVAAKHKFALSDLEQGDEMYMYGLVVGTANAAIPAGHPITTENTTHKASGYDLDARSDYQWQAPDISRFEGKTFDGYHRADGQVGTANYWLVFPLVFCENRNIEVLKKAFEKALGYEKESKYEQMVSSLVQGYQSGKLDEVLQKDNLLSSFGNGTAEEVFENIKVRFITHQGGCGGIRQDAETLCRLLAGYVKNPNVAGATVLSLGCQNAEIKIFQAALDALGVDKPVEILDQQTLGSEEQLIGQAIQKTFAHLAAANQISRQPAPLSKLTIGMECGGSDGFSGISANPSVGYVADLISALGGKVMLAEFPELCGVEQELINRMQNRDHAVKFTDLMRAYEKAAKDSGSGFDMNPSPGNIKDGLITDAMKSAGAAKKGGTSPINDVLDYTEYATAPGLSLLCTPGNDVESTTGLVGSGANVVLFTTGLGTPTGNPVAPILKVSSNTKLAERMSDIIDINTGPVIEGKKTIQEMGESMLEHIIEVASGRKSSKSVEMGHQDFIPWKRGVSL
ncbi:UxaA family hydrolase [Marinoscillum furvescens]|uniref:Altronate hydrolase n=1 Tax=Marinoscillum furvescens DSM 4134 TaxID=1122208 RepID=A0A3D9KWM1_MARFU|nr:altronate dehydratase family protein [Marinoscillum furvescens]RED92290.1 altronate hydrolase [Marinoscillum furvescens DSM 4134]